MFIVPADVDFLTSFGSFWRQLVITLLKFFENWLSKLGISFSTSGCSSEICGPWTSSTAILPRDKMSAYNMLHHIKKMWLLFEQDSPWSHCLHFLKSDAAALHPMYRQPSETLPVWPLPMEWASLDRSQHFHGISPENGGRPILWWLQPQ